jgi:hypothetical protein
MLNQKKLRRKKGIGIFALFALSALLIVSMVPIPTVSALTNITFWGPLDIEGLSYFYCANGSLANALVTVGYPATITTFTINGTNNHIASVDLSTAIYFDFRISDNSTSPATVYHHQYWITPSDSGMTEYKLFFSHNDLLYTINFLDQIGTLKNQPYITATTNLGGTIFPIEKRPIDVQNSVNFMLTYGSRYSLSYSDGTTLVTYGALEVAGTTGIQLIIRGVDFPKTSLLLSEFVHCYSIRDMLTPTGSITTRYEDTSNHTTNVLLEITNETSGAVVFSQNFASNNNFTYIWASAVNATNYEVEATVTHATFGTLYFRQFFVGEWADKPSSPFDLSFLGTIGINTAWFIPALLIVFVAGCFSELTSEAAAVLTVIAAIILTYMGWISIGSGALVAALALSIMAAIVAAKRSF